MLSKPITTVRVVNIESGQRAEDLQRLFENHSLRPLPNGSFCPSGTGDGSTYAATLSFTSEEEAKDAMQLNDKVLGKTRIGVDRDFYGLTVVGAPAEPKKPDLDIIALHGLNGHGYATWNYLHSDHNGGGPMWLRDFLPARLPGARIVTFGYNSTILGSSTSVSGIKDFARDLLQRVVDDRVLDIDKKRPIIFVCHSLGGIVVKQALIMARREPDKYDWIIDTVSSIIFLATPHGGSKTADIGAVASNIASLAFQTPAKQLLKALKPDSSLLSQLSNDFRNLKLNLNVISFYERRRTPHINALIVDEKSSMIGLENERPIPIDATHSDICKFSGVADPLFTPVLAQIKRCVSLALSNSTKPAKNQSKENPHQSLSTIKPPPQHFIVPFAPNPQFYGRNSELALLDELLTASDDTEKSTYPIVAIYGLGGIGKTQLATKYVYNRKDKKPGKSVFWVSADSEDSLESQFTQIAYMLDKTLKPKSSIEQSSDKPEGETRAFLTSSANSGAQSLDTLAVSRLKQWMTAPGNEDWLLVLDNFDEIKTNVRRFLPFGATGSVLITTRDRRLVGSIANAGLELHEMGLAEAERLFYRLCFLAHENLPKDPGGHPEHNAIQHIVKELHCFPLALDQAASFVRENAPMSFQEYLDFLAPRTEDRELLLRFKEANPKYPESIMTTWEISFRHIERLYPRASKILQLLGFLDFSQISESLLKSATKPLEWELGQLEHVSSKLRPQPHSRTSAETDVSFLTNNASFRVAIGVLTSFALVGRTLGAPCDTSLNVHPLVHEWTRVRLNAQPETQATYAVLASLVLYQAFPFDTIVKFSKQTFQGTPISAHFRGKILQIFPHIESVALNLTEYSRNGEEIPPECSAILAAVFLAYKYDLPPDMRTLGENRLSDLCQALNTIARCASNYHHIHSVFALTINWLHFQGDTEVWLQTSRSISDHLNTPDMTKTVNNRRSGVMVVLIACTLKYAQDSMSTSKRIKDLPDLPHREHFSPLSLVLAGLRNSLDLQFAQSAFDEALKFYLEYYFVPLLPPNDYWRLADHFLTEGLSKNGLLRLDPQIKSGYLCACAKLHWERESAKDFDAIMLAYSLAYEVATEALEHDRVSRESIQESTIQEDIRRWSRSSYISSAGGRTGSFAFGVGGLAEAASIKVSSSARGFWEKSLSYVWDTSLSLARAFSDPDILWLGATGISKVAVTLTFDQRRSSSLTFLRRITKCVRDLNPTGTSGLLSLTPYSIQSSLISVYICLEEHNRALALLEPILMISWIRNHYESDQRKPWDGEDDMYYIPTEEQFITYLKHRGVPVQRDQVSRVVHLLYPLMPAAIGHNIGEKNHSSNLESKSKEIPVWWGKIKLSTQRMALDYLFRFRKEESVNPDTHVQNQKIERTNRQFVQDFVPTNTDQEENPVWRVFSSSNVIDAKVETVLEDSTNNLMDQTIACLSALSVIPSATTNLMRAKLNTIRSSDLALTRRLAKLSLLYDMGCLPFFRGGWVKRKSTSLDPLSAVEDSLKAWEESLKGSGEERTLVVMAEKSDSDPDEFFDFDE